MPHIIRPTICWKLDWEELENNQQYFHALCNTLQERDLVVLLRTQSPPNLKPGQQSSCPTGHYVLLPSHGCTMLLKSAATSELILPTGFNQTIDGPNSEASEIIAACLDQLQIEDAYNPLMVKSDLCRCLASHALKGNKSNAPTRTGKKTFQAPQQRYQQPNQNRNTEPRPPLSKPNRAPPKRVVFNKDYKATNKRARAAPALDIYVSSPTDFSEDI